MLFIKSDYSSALEHGSGSFALVIFILYEVQRYDGVFEEFEIVSSVENDKRRFCSDCAK
jgi:hypothetical protein